MRILTHVLVVFSSLLLAAHYMRWGLLPLTLLALLVIPFLFGRGRWRQIPVLLFLAWAVITWIAATLSIVHQRMALNLPWMRAGIIMGCVTIVTIVTLALAWRHFR